MGCCSKSNEDSKAFDGPLKKRTCTDCYCLVFLLAFLCGMGYVGYIGFTNGGDPYKLAYGEDSWGNTCNRNNEPILHANYSGQDLRDRTKTFYFNFWALLFPGLDSSVICVSACPYPDSRIDTAAQLQAYSTSSGIQLCRYDITVSNYFNDVTAQECPILLSADPARHGYGLDKHSAMLSRCIPEAAKAMASSIVNDAASTLSAMAQCDDKGGDIISLVIGDLQSTWKEILYMAALAVGVAMTVTVLMRFFAPVIVWTLVLGSALGSMGGTGFLWYRYVSYKASSEVVKQAQVMDWMYYAIAASVGTALLLLVLLIMRKRIGLVVQLFKEASRALTRMPLLMFQPVWTLVVLVLFVGSMGVVYSYAETSGIPSVDTSTGKVTYTPMEIMKYMKWYYLFGFLWVVQLVFACHQMALAGAVATWYFAEDKKKLGWPILSSIKRLVIYHVGSAAFGAFIIALVQFLRIILAMITKRLRGRGGKLVDFILKCLACCLWCFEKIIKFLNKNAYIMVAIYGYNFCKAARRAFTLLVSNALRVAAINSVGTFVLLLAKLGVAAVPVVVSLELLKSKTELCFVWVPLTIVGVVSLLIAHMFLSVYNMAIDTIFLCFCEDCERNDGITKPYFMSKGLMEYVGNASKALEALKKRKAAEATETENETIASPQATSAGQSKADVQW